MTLTEFKTILKSTDMPVAYHHFKEAQARPFVIYAADGENDLMADNEHYLEIISGYIELYTDIKDPAAEETIKAALKNNHISYRKENEDYIDTEEVFYVRWSFSFI
ncbi:MAG TPA: hypothetical protein VEF53_14385 [Patescibacteria group bacterium]|nr:hypothetical protein [Patescibacteria group bacterium]